MVRLYTRAARWALGAGAAAVLAGCGESDPDAALARLHMPSAEYRASADAGRDWFRQHCARCHGDLGQGSRTGPPLVHKTYEPGHHPDAAFFLAVKDGVRQHHWNFGDMPPLRAAVSPEQTADITAWVRRRQRAVGIE